MYFLLNSVYLIPQVIMYNFLVTKLLHKYIILVFNLKMQRPLILKLSVKFANAKWWIFFPIKILIFREQSQNKIT
jgi:hypothetical protein